MTGNASGGFLSWKSCAGGWIALVEKSFFFSPLRTELGMFSQEICFLCLVLGGKRKMGLLSSLAWLRFHFPVLVPRALFADQVIASISHTSSLENRSLVLPPHPGVR